MEAEDMGFKKQVIFDHYNEPKGCVKQAPVKRTEVEQAVDVCTYVCVCVCVSGSVYVSWQMATTLTK